MFINNIQQQNQDLQDLEFHNYRYVLMDFGNIL